ncbi:Major facilitator superfamily domain, general substrate transporter [Penicillium griseofulvum]|uniref:beta-glucosidase n=1 Tax=Penicillium patulum TaxID=5078 RepID=A0A135LNB5_PENPA|nr:Major facilitator superfamily domain, general substrate transporter [Penicillium griseofulvum]KXG50456.1 Major facilitator superfamily domain, general substrate transporter [Penicillium griseofulvum]
MGKIYTIGLATFAATGSFLFGYDSGIFKKLTTIKYETDIIGVMTDVIASHHFLKFFNTTKTSTIIGAINSTFSRGAVIGALMAGLTIDRFGRRRTIQMGALLATIGDILQCAAQNLVMILVGRIIAGWAVGVLRLSQQMIGVCFIVSTWIGYGSLHAPDTNSLQWRFPLAFQALPAFMLFAGMFWLPESPRHLIEKDHDDKALSILKRLHYDGTNMEWIQTEFTEIRTTINTERAITAPGWTIMFKVPQWRTRLLQGTLVQVFSQMTGINVEEGFTEDPYLSGELSYATVVGLESRNVSATVKHFIGYSNPEQGLNTGPVHGGERELRTTYDGIPSVSDAYTLTDILRGELDYKYWVVSDAGATDRVCTYFKLCQGNPIDSDAVTLEVLPAGTDVEMGGGSFNFKQIPSLVEDGRLDIKIVDQAVSRLLRAKFEMGCLRTHSPLFRNINRESIVLLENHNNTLPLKKTSKVAVIGPMAHGFVNYGDYVIGGSQSRGVTPLDGIRAAVGDSASVTYAQGCERWSSDQSGFPQAIQAAKEADVAVVAVGTWSRDQDELWAGVNATDRHAATVDKTNSTIKDTLTASVDVTNTSPVDGTEVVQLYIVDTIASVDVPNRRLKGFKKLRIKAGETASIKLPVSIQEIGLWNRKMKYVVEPGEFTVLIGKSSTDIIGNATFYVS